MLVKAVKILSSGCVNTHTRVAPPGPGAADTILMSISVWSKISLCHLSALITKYRIKRGSGLTQTILLMFKWRERMGLVIDEDKSSCVLIQWCSSNEWRIRRSGNSFTYFFLWTNGRGNDEQKKLNMILIMAETPVTSDHVRWVVSGQGGNTCKVTRDPGREETQLDCTVNML